VLIFLSLLFLGSAHSRMQTIYKPDWPLRMLKASDGVPEFAGH